MVPTTATTTMAPATIALALGKRLLAFLLGYLFRDLRFCFGNKLLAARNPIVLA